MNARRLAAAAIVVLIGLLCWFLWSRDPGSRTATRDVGRAAQAPAPLQMPTPAVASVERKAIEEPPPAVAKKPGPPLARVRGRCVAAESGAPLAGCNVMFDGGPGDVEQTARYGKVEWSDPDPVITGADGRFEFAFVPPPPFQHALDVRSEGRAPRTARWGSFVPGQVEDLGDIALARGFSVDGYVVDTTGAPVPGVRVSLEKLPLPLRASMGANDSRGGGSDARGYFRVEAAIPPGTWSIAARSRGMKLVSPDTVTVAEDRGTDPVMVVVRSMPSISGVVVDETGAGVARIGLMAESANGSGSRTSGRTGADGTFTIFAVDDDLAPVRLTSHDPGPCEGLAEPTPAFEWGTRDVRIELRRALSLELTVVERGSGAPVEDFAVSCFTERATWSNQRGARSGGRHPGGTVTVDQVWRGNNMLLVYPKDPELRVNDPIVFEAREAPLAPIRVELDRMRTRVVRVVNAAREPVPGSQVELVRLGSEPLNAESSAIDPRRGVASFEHEPDFRAHVLLAKAQTNRIGLARLEVPPGAGGLGLRVTSAHHPPAVLSDAHFPDGDQPLEIVVPSGGRIAGVLALTGYASGMTLLQFVRVGWRDKDPDLRATIEGDGSFESPSLAPGTYEVFLALDHQEDSEHGAIGRRLRIDPELASVDVVAGQTSHVQLDARDLAAAQVSGSVLLDGAPFGGCRVILQRAQDGARYGQFVPDAQGRFEADGLPPGTWSASIVVGDFKTSDGERIAGGGSFELAPGARLTRDFAFTRR